MKKVLLVGLLVARLAGAVHADSMYSILQGYGNLQKDEDISLEGTRVIQKVQGGYLARIRSELVYTPDGYGQVFFLQTAKEYYDGDHLAGYAVYKGGGFSYTDTLGSERTVRKFIQK